MQEFVGILVVAGMFLAVLAPAFWNLFRKERGHWELTGNVVNYDLTLREFWYRSEKNIAEILEILSVPGTYEDHTYQFDRKEMVLSLSSILLEDTTRYIVLLFPQESGTQIQLYRTEGMHRTNKVGVDLVFFENFFCKAVLCADPIPLPKKKL